MAITTEVSRVEYTGNGTATTFAYPFRIFAKTDLRVIVNDSLKTVDIDYTVAGIGQDQGNVVFTTAPANGAKIVIRRKRPLKQETDLTNVGRFFPEQLEDALDHLAMLTQQLEDAVSRSIKLQETEAPTMGVEVPKAADRALKFLGFDATGKPIAALPGSSTLGTDHIFLTATGVNGLRLRHETTAPEKALVEGVGVPIHLKTGGSFMTEVIGSGGSELRFGPTTANEGGYLTSLSASQGALSGGAQFTGGSWVARAANAAIVEAAGGNVGFYGNTSLTIGSSYTPTLRFIVGPASVTSHVHFIPGGNGTLDLGLSGQAWRKLFVQTIEGPVTMTGSLSFSPDATIDLTPLTARPRDVHVGRDLLFGRQLLAPDGSVTVPSISFASELGLGFYRRTTGSIALAISGARKLEFGSSTLFASDVVLSWGDNSNLDSATLFDLVLRREESGTLALRRGASPNVPHSLRIYNLFTDSLNYERGVLAWISNVFRIGTEAAGTGTARDLELWTGGSGRWRVEATTGHLLPITDAAFDLGRAAHRVRTGYFSTSVGIGVTATPAVALHIGSGGTTQGYIRLESGGGVSREANLYSPPTGGLIIDTSGNEFPIALHGSQVDFSPGAVLRARVTTTALVPAADNTYNLGSSTERWKFAYAKNFIGSSQFKTTSPAALVAGDNNNYSGLAPDFSYARLQAGAGGSTITGIAGGEEGHLLIITNVSTNNLTLAHEDINSAESNRILTGTGANIVLGQNDSAVLVYDATSARWRVVAVHS